MKKIACLIVSFLILCNAQNSFSLKVKSGDNELDMDLNEMNVRAKADIKLFNTEIKAAYNVTDNTLDNLYVKYKMEPADVYMTLELGSITGKPVVEIANVYSVKKDKGWGVIAKELGIKPGSPEFHRLKNNAKKHKKGKDKDDKDENKHHEHPGKGKGKGKNK